MRHVQESGEPARGPPERSSAPANVRKDDASADRYLPGAQRNSGSSCPGTPTWRLLRRTPTTTATCTSVRRLHAPQRAQLVPDSWLGRTDFAASVSCAHWWRSGSWLRSSAGLAAWQLEQLRLDGGAAGTRRSPRRPPRTATRRRRTEAPRLSRASDPGTIASRQLVALDSLGGARPAQPSTKARCCRGRRCP